MSTIAWIGLGHMGAPMAAHLVSAGHAVRGVDPVPAARDAAAARGIQLVDSVAEAVQGADACLTSLPGPAQVREVYGAQDGVFAHAAAGNKPGQELSPQVSIDVQALEGLVAGEQSGQRVQMCVRHGMAGKGLHELQLGI